MRRTLQWRSQSRGLSPSGDVRESSRASGRFCEAPITLNRSCALTLPGVRARFTESAKGKLVARRGRKATDPLLDG